uniref:Protein Flattop n=2 Tax=Erpetoichthys calabaricus TaxID=27687 RepID=A0A8C4S6W4_ERPCA
MAVSFNANQFEHAFSPRKLQNWTIPRRHKENPATLDGHTQFIADDRGHLLPGLRGKSTAWGSFSGTWDMPCCIPPSHINYTARSEDAIIKLKKRTEENTLICKRNGHSGVKRNPRTPMRTESQQPQASSVLPDANKPDLNPQSNLELKTPSAQPPNLNSAN